MLIAIAKPFSPSYSEYVGSIKERIFGFIESIRSSKALSLLVILVLAAAIPLTVFIAQKQQDIRQRAATPASNKLSPERFGSEKDRIPRFVPDQIIIKLKPGYIIGQTSGDKTVSVQSETTEKSTIAPSLQNQLINIGSTEIKRSVPSAKKPEEVVKIFSQKFPQRAGTLQIQSKVSSIPDLTSFYTVTFDPQRFGIQPRELTILKNEKMPPDRYYEEVKKYERVLEILRSNPAIEDVQLNYIYTTNQINPEGGGGVTPTPTVIEFATPTPLPSPSPLPGYPNDPYFWSSNSWGQGYDDQWDMKKIKADLAWSVVATSSSTVIVAVSDTGVDYNHEDLRDVMWTDSNGKHGYDFVECERFDWHGNCLQSRSPDDDPMDDDGHGTHVAGTIGAEINNGKGIAGTASNVRIMAVKGLNSNGGGLDPWLADGIIWATDHGAQVINMSWGGYGDSPILRDALDYAYTLGVVSVASAGNSSWDARDFSPASFPTVITVGASDPDDKKVWFSNWGPKIDLVAPGGGTDSQCYSDLCAAILSTEASLSTFPSELKVITHGAGYARLAGTSMAAPHVAGAAAMILGKNSSLFPSQVRAALLNSVDDVGLEGKDTDTGYGRLNVYRAATEINTQIPLAPLVEISSPSSGRVLKKTATINGTINQPGGEAVFSIAYSTSKDGPWNTSGITLTNNGQGNINSAVIGTWDTTKTQDGKYYVRIQAGEQNKSTEQIVIAVNNNLPNGWPARIYEQGYGWGPITTGDVDGDGRDDTVIKFGNELVFLNADGQEKEPWPLALGDYDDYVGTQPAIGNVTNNNPGNEIVIASEGSTKNDNTVLSEGLYVLNASGSVLPGWPRSQVDTPYGFTIKLNSSFYPPVLKDLDGDGVNEILYTSYNSDYTGYTDLLTVFKGDGTVVQGFPVLLPGWIAYGPYVTTVNGETRIILVHWDNNTTGLRMSQYNTRGQLVFSGENITSSTLPLFSTNSDGEAIFADVTGDGNKEVVWTGKIGPTSWINPETTKIAFYAVGLDGKMVASWPKAIDTGITEKDECDSNRRNCYTASYFRMFYSVTPGDFDQDGNIDLVQMGVHLAKNKAEDPFSETPLLFGIKTAGDGSASQFNFSMPQSRIPLAYSYQTVMDTNGDGKQEIIYLAYDNATSRYYLSSIQLSNGTGEIVLGQDIAPRCSNYDMNGPRMFPSLAQLHALGRPSIITPICGNISDDYIRRLDVYPIRMEGSVASHAWPKYLHDSQNSKEYALVSEQLAITPTPSPTPAPPTITSIRPAWIKEEYKAQPWVNQGDKVAIKGSGFSLNKSDNKIYIGSFPYRGAYNGTSDSVSSDGTSLTFTLSTELGFEIGNYYDLWITNVNGRSNSMRIRVISPTVLFSVQPNPTSMSEQIISLRGINFGPKTGSVFIYPAPTGIPVGAGTLETLKTMGGGGGLYLGEIKSWKNNEIRFVLPKEFRLRAKRNIDYFVWVNGSYGGQFIYSSNRIKLRVK